MIVACFALVSNRPRMMAEAAVEMLMGESALDHVLVADKPHLLAAWALRSIWHVSGRRIKLKGVTSSATVALAPRRDTKTTPIGTTGMALHTSPSCCNIPI